MVLKSAELRFLLIRMIFLALQWYKKLLHSTSFNYWSSDVLIDSIWVKSMIITYWTKWCLWQNVPVRVNIVDCVWLPWSSYQRTSWHVPLYSNENCDRMSPRQCYKTVKWLHRIIFFLGLFPKASLSTIILYLQLISSERTTCAYLHIVSYALHFWQLTLTFNGLLTKLSHYSYPSKSKRYL